MWRLLSVFVLLIGFSAPLHGQVVVPSDLLGVDGDISQHWPLGCGLGGLANMRYQQVYAGDALGAVTITEIAFRQDLGAGSAFGPVVIPGVTITLSSTSRAVDGLSLTYAENVGSDVVVVFDGDLSISSLTSTDVPRPFDVVIPLSSSFSFDPGEGANLLFDITIPECQMATFFDATSNEADSLSRAVGGASNAVADFIDSIGLVTSFGTLSPEVVVPGANATLEGDTQNTQPLGCQPNPGFRWQQVYVASEFEGPLEVGAIQFRQDVDFGMAFGPLLYPDVRIMLSSGAPDPDTLSATFADNLGPDATVVFDGQMALESSPSTDVPRPFDVTMSFESAFSYDPADGNLLVDLRIGACPIGSLGLWFDAVFSASDSVSRAHSPAADDTTAFTVDTAGMVTRFLPSVVFVDGFESGDTSGWQ